jgi:opacity protein-like surface antigen
MPIGVICDYHFALSDPKWDLFLGLGLGYVIVSESNNFPQGQAYSYAYGSGLFFTGQAGARYFFSPSMALRAEYGFSYLPFAVGLDFRF